jgi:hypothetical protein
MISMALIDQLRDEIAAGLFEFSQHALDQSILRHVSVRDPGRSLVKIITVYQPDPVRWVNDRKRRS